MSVSALTLWEDHCCTEAGIPHIILKYFVRGYGECENRWMDEHIRLFEGRTVVVEQGDRSKCNLNNLTWWMEKRNGYATREMVDMLLIGI